MLALGFLARLSPDFLGMRLVGGVAAEVEVLRVHVASEFILEGNYIDPEKWSPLIYNFRHYYRLADKELGKTFRAER